MKLGFRSLILMVALDLFSPVMMASEVLVYRHETMPWCGTVDGRDAGVTVEILEQITLHGGPTFTYQSLPWKRAQIMVQKNTGTAIIPLTRTPTREANYSWIVPLVPNQIRLTLYNESAHFKGIIEGLDLEQAKALSVGVIQGSSIIPTLEALGFASIYEANDVEQLVDLLVKERFDAMVESKLVDIYQWQKLGYKKDALVAGPNIESVNYIYLGAAPDFPIEVAQEIRAAMAKIQANGIYDEILERWY
jgi:ABC-type amino acid transport substrate-binding protein